MNSAWRTQTIFLLSAALFLTACSRNEQKTVAFKMEEETQGLKSSAQPAKTASREPAKKFKTFRVYTDANSPDNHYAPSGWMGDWGDIQLSASVFDNPHSGTTCIRVTYTAQKSKGANWAGIYWQHPPNNWGGQKGCFDLGGASRLAFWARGENGGEKIEEFRVGGIAGEFPDSDIVGIGPIVLTAEWAPYEIDLKDRDLSCISGGFMWSANSESNPQGFTMYLDDIRYE